MTTTFDDIIEDSLFRYKREKLAFLGLFGLTIFVTYYLPSFIGSFYMLGLLIIFFRSKKDGFWIAFIAMILLGPGGFLYVALPGLPLPSFIDRTISMPEIFLILTAIKIKVKNITYQSIIFRNSLRLLVFYALFLFILGIAMEVDLYKGLRTIRFIIPYIAFFTVPTLLYQNREWLRFTRLIFLGSIITFIMFLFQVVFGYPPVELVAAAQSTYSLGDTREIGELVQVDFTRPVSGIQVFLISFTLSIFLLFSRIKIVKRWYASLIMLTAYLSVFMSATRGWIIAFSAALILFFFILSKNPLTLIKRLSPILIILALLIVFTPVDSQIKKAYERFETVYLLLGGDVTAGGTLSRLDKYTPVVMEQFYQSPIIGWGFSPTFYKYSNGHVGWPTLLLNGGIILAILYLYYFMYVSFINIKVNAMISRSNIFKSGFFAFIIWLIIILIIQSTSRSFFAGGIQFYTGWIELTIVPALSHVMIMEAINYENENNRSLVPATET